MNYNNPKPQLVKFCEKRHNIATTCPTLFVGTLKYFRENHSDEAGLINDSTEGSGTYYDVKFDNHYKNFTVPNAFIFCATQVQPMNEVRVETGKSYSEHYDDMYFIHSFEYFAQKMSNLLLASLTLDDLDLSKKPIDIMTLADWKHIQILIHFDSVSYVERKEYSDNLPEALLERIKYFSFSKPLKYQIQNEFRFFFIPFHPKIGLIPVKTPKILDLRITQDTVDKLQDFPPIVRHNRF